MGEWIPYAELTAEQKALVDSEYEQIRAKAALSGYGLDVLVNDSNSDVRCCVIKHGYRLDKLVDDDSAYTRAAVADQGYGLDKLIDDDFWVVREAVARQGYGLDKLVNDENLNVRKAVAEQGYGLDKLVSDPEWYVRYEIARQGYGLDKLIDDEHVSVRPCAEYSMRRVVDSKTLDIEATKKLWIAANPDKCVLPENQKQPVVGVIEDVVQEQISATHIEALKTEFHKQLQMLQCDLGGSLADMVEDCLSVAIKHVNEQQPNPVADAMTAAKAASEVQGRGMACSASRDVR